MPPLLDPDDFVPCVGTAFDVTVGEHLVELVLDRVDEHPTSPGAPRARPFDLLFLGEVGRPLEQETYPMRHPVLGEVAVFIVPIGPADDGRQRYQAVFN